ncbi:unnamed protein product [Plutella xylostella]|uniref:(diamondback moth) hypothetical protein n=1 Tax=Plutella xylostella TaxID=51655 RepID=A0A8S4FZ11_PLUXY|nr:unnamed protein product [Plutella xylostella]
MVRQYSAPSQQYGPPGSGSGRLGSGSGQAQSRQYLPPNARSNGYDGSDGEGNGEPANYSFDYKVQDDESGNDFGHRESRMGDRTEGLYYVLLPDGRKQTVEYEADQDGYRPKISYEDTGRGQGGYDRNSQDLPASGYQGGSGPY